MTNPLHSLCGWFLWSYRWDFDPVQPLETGGLKWVYQRVINRINVSSLLTWVPNPRGRVGSLNLPRLRRRVRWVPHTVLGHPISQIRPPPVSVRMRTTRGKSRLPRSGPSPLHPRPLFRPRSLFRRRVGRSRGATSRMEPPSYLGPSPLELTLWDRCFPPKVRVDTTPPRRRTRNSTTPYPFDSSVLPLSREQLHPLP